MNKYKVYCHELFDGRKYIGITCQETRNRWRHDGTGYKTCKHFYRAINKYGWDNFKHYILFENLSKEEAEKKELELIKEYNTTNSKNGFNVLQGGFIRSDYHHTEETKKRISNTMKGMVANNKGLKQSKETIEKRRLKLIGHKVNQENLEKLRKQLSKKVRCIELNIVFDNEETASSFINGNRHICDVCKGKRITAGGYHWEYIN